MKKNLPFFTLAFFCFSMSFAQSGLWTPIAENDARSAKVNRNVTPTSYRLYRLNLSAMRNTLAAAPLRGQSAARSNVVIELPNAAGQLEHFRVIETPIMEPALAIKYPMIKSYAAQGIDDPTAVARFSVTQFGLHSMTLSAQKSTAYIDPYTTDTQNYIVYDRASLNRLPNDFACLTDEVPLKSLQEDRRAQNRLLSDTDDKKLRTYRLAQSCTAEYGNIFAGTGTDAEKKANIQAQMAITMTRVNGVYENDLAITMVFVANNDAVIYFGATNSDPWNGEYNTQTGITIDANIGFSNYDIGHNFNTSGGGNAGCIGCVCSPDTNPNGNHKGTGMTGRGNPTGDAFDIDYVAHEMGHQFGGYHIQSSSGCRSGNGSTEVEPGSGSSIMGYAGICSTNVQNNSDAYFGYVNIRDILDNVKNGVSASCAQITDFDNNPPTADAGQDYVIPKSTPFMLIGAATDPDGDAITYNWEENDPENPNSSAAPTPTRVAGPMYRSLNASTSNVRLMPNLATVLAGNSFNTWEANPSVARTLNFSLTVRDNHAGGGQTASDLMKVTVSGNAGPFLMTAPNTNVSWAAGTVQTVTWNVAGTDANGVNAKYVDIYLSTNGGNSFPVLLASKVPNDGAELVTVPNTVGTQNRIMVRGYNNIFYDISNANFAITAPENTFAVAFSGVAEEQNKTICTGASVSYNVTYAALNGFSGTTDFSVSGNPAGVTVTFTPTSLSADGTTVMQITTAPDAAAGFYTLVVTATSGAVTKTANFYLDLFSADFPSMVLTTPADMAENQGTSVNLVWEANANATLYDVQVYADAAMTITIAAGTTDQTNYTVSGLAQDTNYYWRVLPKNSSCSGTYSDSFQFKTGVVSCNNYVSANVPLTISASGAPTVNSTVAVTGSGVISDVNVTLALTHSWLADLTVSLIGPSGTTVELFTDACGNANDASATFDDEGVAIACGNNPAIAGIVIPAQALSAFNGENANGTWTLRIADGANQDGGSLTSWNLDVCSVAPPLATASNAFAYFAISPNPNNGSFNVKLNTYNAEPVNVSVFDMRGRAVYNRDFRGQSLFSENIGLDVTAGVYLVTVKNGERQETRKIVVQ
ncbi:MAG TPA: zinc-dependent metalloprotease family protein [Flavobacterium sp.]|nr:zinc-dependent metalloprotease family protein [Flavobacterium sp.]